ncbi:MAG: DinB family protein [Bacteroidetes bacterium]|nr:MAG: DinB family protein [Bacteroidota bacterium]
MKNLLIQYTQYNLWANSKLAELLMTLDPALYDRELKSSFPSIRKTVNHIWGAEFIWLERLKGNSPTEFPGKNVSPDMPVNTFLEASKAFSRFTEEQAELFFTAETVYKNLKGDTFKNVNSGIVMHCMNHSTFHRGQLVTMLRESGVERGIPSTDLIAYLRI